MTAFLALSYRLLYEFGYIAALRRVYHVRKLHPRVS